MNNQFPITEFAYLFNLKKIIDAYESPGRYYHNWNHILDIFYSCTVNEISLTNNQIVAILYHDIVYFPGNPSNEHQSSCMAQDDFDGYFGFDTEKINDIIMATKTHAKTGDNEIDTVLDLDMLVFGFTSSYNVYTGNIRREFSHLSDADFFPARKKFLQQLLDRGYIYITPRFRRLYENHALTNIKTEIETLTNKGY